MEDLRHAQPAATNRTRANRVEIEMFLSSVGLRSRLLQFTSIRSDVCTLFVIFGGTKKKWIVEFHE